MLSCLGLDVANYEAVPGGAAEHIRTLLAGGVDGHLLLAITEWQRVTPLVWASLSRVAPGALAPAAAAAFEAVVRSNAMRNLYLTRRLPRLANLFAEKGIICKPSTTSPIRTPLTSLHSNCTGECHPTIWGCLQTPPSFGMG
jgi:hypothetical protein